MNRQLVMNFAQGGQSVLVGQLDIHDHDIGQSTGRNVQTRLGIVRSHHLVTRATQSKANRLCDLDIVFDDECSRGFMHG
jgi:hypothetical protein